MQTRTLGAGCVVFVASMFLTLPTFAQMGRRFPSEKKVVPDPVTGVLLTFLTTGPSSDAKIYQTHPQWTADGKWLIFRSSNRMPDQGTQAFAVNEENGDIVQVTDKGYTGMLCVARKSMRLYIMRNIGGSSGQGRGFRRGGPSQIIEIDLAKLFADSEAGTIKPATNYERVCGTIPTNMGAGGDMGLDANEDFAYFRVRGDDVGRHLAPGGIVSILLPCRVGLGEVVARIRHAERFIRFRGHLDPKCRARVTSAASPCAPTTSPAALSRRARCSTRLRRSGRRASSDAPRRWPTPAWAARPAALSKCWRRIQQNVRHGRIVFDVGDEERRRVLLQAGRVRPVELPDVFEPRGRVQDLHGLNGAAFERAVVHDRHPRL